MRGRINHGEDIPRRARDIAATISAVVISYSVIARDIMLISTTSYTIIPHLRWWRADVIVFEHIKYVIPRPPAHGHAAPPTYRIS